MLLQIAIIAMGMGLPGYALLTKSRREKLLPIGEYPEGIVFDKAGDKVRVLYNPDKPSEFVVETGQSETIGRLIISIAGLGLTVLGLFKLISYYN